MHWHHDALRTVTTMMLHQSYIRSRIERRTEFNAIATGHRSLRSSSISDALGLFESSSPSSLFSLLSAPSLVIMIMIIIYKSRWTKNPMKATKIEPTHIQDGTTPLPEKEMEVQVKIETMTT